MAADVTNIFAIVTARWIIELAVAVAYAHACNSYMYTHTYAVAHVGSFLTFILILGFIWLLYAWCSILPYTLLACTRVYVGTSMYVSGKIAMASASADVDIWMFWKFWLNCAYLYRIVQTLNSSIFGVTFFFAFLEELVMLQTETLCFHWRLRKRKFEKF